MKTKTMLYLVLLLLSFSLAAAVNVSTDKNEYSSSEIVTANITSCVGTSITKFLNPNGNLVDLKSGQNNWTTNYHTSSSNASGKYTVSTSCSNGLAQVKFCVNAPGCLVEEDQEEECIPEWDCGEWSSCVGQAEKRTCIDKNDCKGDREETRICTACQESWTCLGWSDCQDGVRTRTCYDQNSCGTTLNKPTDEQACQEPAPQVPELVEEESFFTKNKGLIIAVALAAVLLIITLVYFWKWKGKEASLAEVREWMSLEREKGVSDEDIHGALEKRGWLEKDIKRAFKKLK
ncbi:hypothetical protein HYU08_03660 [Candidatus Woesearchaeota archaeon]|nr:hypothetical protein [Candidatus Woesearchaeota archaeon]